VAAVVPTAGLSPHLERCLEALRAEGIEAVVVHQGEGEPPEPARRLAGRVLRLPRNLGFAAATNVGIAATAGDYLATVNDDAVVEPGWASALIAALDADPGAAAAQGTNLQLADPARLDGRGLAWNRWWQAVQVGHGEAAAATAMPRSTRSSAWQMQVGHGEAAAATAEGAARSAPDARPAPPPDGGSEAVQGTHRSMSPEIVPDAPPREVFGVSATAALYRRSALEAVALAPGEVFDERLGAYYEDVDLACRLRRAGWGALWEPAGRALHAGSATGDRRRRWRLTRLYGNRWAVVARCLGRRFPAAAPRMAARDLADLARAFDRGDLSAAGAIAAGWARALALLPRALHRGAPCVGSSPEEALRG
jgi:GT2 family glycosyltransferase